jgi:PAS domain S-box-containing protein
MPFLPYWLNLDSFSIIKLAALIMSLLIAVYLFSLRKKTTATIMLALLFCGAVIFNTASLLEFSSFHYWRPNSAWIFIRAILEAHIGPSLALLSLMLFAYSFPRPHKREEKELWVALGVSSFLSVARLIFELWTLLFHEFPKSDFSLTPAYFLVLFGTIGLQFLFVVFLLFRKVVLLSAGRTRSAWARLLRPDGRDARTARSLALTILIPLVSTIGYMLMTFGILSPSIAIFCYWLVFLLFYFSFVVVYLNHAVEPTSFQVKLVGLTLSCVLAILGLVAAFVGKATENDFNNVNLAFEPRTITFTPNQGPGYGVQESPYTFDADMGGKLSVGYGEYREAWLPFAFPFFRGSYSSIQVLHCPMIYLGSDIKERGWGGYNPQPCIAPLIMNLDPSRGGGIYLKSAPHALTLTWFELPEFGFSDPNTVQLVLREDGSFNFSFGALHPRSAYNADQLDNLSATATGGISYPGQKTGEFGPRLTGIHPGGRDVPLEQVRFAGGLPVSTAAPAVIFESFEEDYSHYLHARMAILAVILFASTFFILFVFPLLFRTTLIRPLRSLYEGMKKVEEGDMDVVIPEHFHDEIGFLARSFTSMLQSIRKAEADFRLLADNAQDCIVIFSNGRSVYANRRAGELTGYAGRGIGEMDFADLFRSCPSAERVESERRPIETRLTTRAGEEILVELALSGALWHGKPARAAIFSDITERKRSEEEARQRHQYMMQMDKLTSLGVLAASMAHEINNPNQTILANSTLLRRASPGILSILEEHSRENTGYLIAGLDEAAFRENFPAIVSGIKECSLRIDGIIKNLKAFSREEPDLSMSRVDVNAVIRASVDLVAGSIKRATDRFNLDLTESLPEVKGNSQRLEQVIINLLLNACQAISRRESGISVHSRLGGDGRVMVEIRDEGAGIPAENLGKLAKPFFTTKRSIGGTGLGLYVSHAIVGEHGGLLDFSSKPGVGTVATISLPVEAEP